MAQAEIFLAAYNQTITLDHLEPLAVATEKGATVILYTLGDIMRLRLSPQEAKDLAAKLAPHIP